MWYTINVKGRGQAHRVPRVGIGTDPKKLVENLKKPLDKSPDVWYNVREVKSGGHHDRVAVIQVNETEKVEKTS